MLRRRELSESLWGALGAAGQHWGPTRPSFVVVMKATDFWYLDDFGGLCILDLAPFEWAWPTRAPIRPKRRRLTV